MGSKGLGFQASGRELCMKYATPVYEGSFRIIAITTVCRRMSSNAENIRAEYLHCGFLADFLFLFLVAYRRLLWTTIIVCAL